LNLSQFGDIAGQFRRYDDTDPVWLPDGRIVFSSTRWPSLAMYGAARTSNLFVVNADGSELHRITTERNGAERPQIDPLTGRIVYSRWWRNFRLAANDMATLTDPAGGFRLKDGLVVANESGYLGDVPGGSANVNRNAWHLASINPDGTDLKLWGIGSNTFLLGEDANFAYGGSFAPDGSFYGNFFPMKNGTEASGFGGLRHYLPGMSGRAIPLIGITSEIGYELVSQNPASYGVNRGAYASEPALLPDGRLFISWAPDINQDYGIYLFNPIGGEKRLIYDNPGTTELRARLLHSRPLPPVIVDRILQRASLLPPTAAGPYTTDGTFTFQALNVYFNAPVDTNIISAMPVGAAGTIRFFVDHQRDQQIGSHERLDWPILLGELPVKPDGSVVNQLPANVPLFEQIRTPLPEYKVPLTGRTSDDMGGAAHVAGLNFGHPGEVQRCVGCHTGHSLIPVPTDDEAAKFTNLAPTECVKNGETKNDEKIDSKAALKRVQLTARFGGREAGARRRCAVGRVDAFNGSGRVNPNRRRDRCGGGCAPDKAFGVLGISLVEGGLALGENGLGLPQVNHSGGEQAQGEMMMLLVVPGEKSSGPGEGLVF
jgi:hypothetical protein